MIPGLSGPFPQPISTSGISFNDVGDYDDSNALTTYTSGTLSFSSGYSHVIIGCAGGGSASRSLSSGTLNSVAQTDVVSTSGSQGVAGFLVFAHPGAGSFSFTATFSGSMLRAGFTVMECNITSGTPVSTGTDTTATSNALDAAVSDQTAPYLLVGMCFNNASSRTVSWTCSTGDTFTELSDNIWATSRTYSMAGLVGVTATTSDTVTATFNGTTTIPAAAVGLWT